MKFPNILRVICVLAALAISGNSAAADGLLDAVKAGDSELVAEELPKKDAETCAAWVSRPLTYAVRDGFVEIVEMLLDGCPDPRAALLYGGSLRIAAENDDVPIMAMLLDRGADPNSLDRATGQSALHVAAEAGALSAAFVLVAAGAKVRLSDKQNLRPLDLALHGGHEAVADLLRASGAE